MWLVGWTLNPSKDTELMILSLEQHDQLLLGTNICNPQDISPVLTRPTWRHAISATLSP